MSRKLPWGSGPPEANRRSEEHTSELQSLSLHDALPICRRATADRTGQSELSFRRRVSPGCRASSPGEAGRQRRTGDRKSTRLNSSHFPYTTLFRSVAAQQQIVQVKVSYRFAAAFHLDVAQAPLGKRAARGEQEIGRAHV